MVEIESNDIKRYTAKRSPCGNLTLRAAASLPVATSLFAIGGGTRMDGGKLIVLTAPLFKSRDVLGTAEK